MQELNKKQKALLESVKTTKTNKGKSKLTAGDKYEIKMTHNGKTIYFVYNDNIYNKGDKNDFLFALLTDAEAYESNTPSTFAWSFGYEDTNEALRVYDACEINAKKLHTIFTDAEIKELETIFENY